MKTRINKTDALFLFFALLSHTVYFIINLIVGGNHIDEAMLSLNAFSLADKGTDISMVKLPLYFDTWLHGGQSPFGTYLSAAFVKLFGHNLFAIRFPAYIFSILGVAACFMLINELKLKSKYRFAMLALLCVSPWIVFSGVYVLDCNYFAHILIIALFFLTRALNTNKTVYYIISMFFCALCFYCYIAGIIVLPITITVFFLTGIIKKKISIKNTVISFFTVLLFSLPFVLFGLINLGVLDEIKFFGLSITKMQHYTRYDSMVFASGSIVDIIINAAKNLVITFVDMSVIDYTAIGIGPNIFMYGNLLGGIFMIFGIVNHIFALIKKASDFSFNQKLFAVSAFSGIISFFMVVNNENYIDLFYRYGVLSYFLIYFESVGIINVFSLIKKANYKKMIIAYTILSFMLFNAEFFGLYVNQTKAAPDVTYGDSLYACLDDCKDEKVIIYMDDSEYHTRVSVYLRYYYYGSNIDFVNIRDEILKRDILGDKQTVQCTNDDSILIKTSSDNTVINEEKMIVSDMDIKNIDNEKYEIKDYGFWNLCELN